ncbi:hypothetical protein BH23VER1_BH23VER1_07230 [soil metagenome]
MVGMKILTILAANWFTFIQSVGIVGSLLLAVASFRDNARARRAETFLAISSEHQKIWRDYYRNPALRRVRETAVDLDASPPTLEERRFVQAVILHANAVFQARRLGSVIEPEGAREDIRIFFSLPIPGAVYAEQKHLLDRTFAAYVERALESRSTG